MLGSNAILTNSLEQRRQYMDSGATTPPPLPRDLKFEMEQALRGGREVRIEGGPSVAASASMEKLGGSDAHPGTKVYGPW
jgi:hypothetical protein